ncbi:MAG: hypothetical protein H0W44_06110 [Gammaproteobacteria bacterium]|nr:hypothetical protein [Gammaproteobacteria bacterium]
MSAQKIIAILLIIAGTLALVYGGFTYTKETHKADVGPVSIAIDDKERVNVPVWAGIGAIAIGGALLLIRRKI